MKYDMTTPLVEKRARRKAKKQEERTRQAEIEFQNKHRAGKRALAFCNPGDHAAGERIQEHVKDHRLYLEEIVNPNVMDRFQQIIEEAEHVDIALLTNADSLSIGKLVSLLWSCKTGNVTVRLLGQCNLTRRVLIAALN